ncbi:hypothetical protein LJC22_07565 [Desulfosarcina sp. OttesenSCG-928-G10]|nr:hypothetical protein [Desulfosarcina sp. OttesenSCG-928-G10]MDL2321695.1 hypothetical protein [Desulfosarcina sp. OttesenSCG-928-B08]
MENQLLLLINDYLFQSKRAVSFLKDNFGKINLLRSVRKGEIPKDGMIKTIEYSFHGVGCIVFFDDCFIDFDFGPNGRFDGFDAWRLFDFAKQFPA